ncbi:cyclophilin-like fold protein [Spirilliplanes yamanashiensis]|uniref:Cyclophilin-like domain-containing protein n=1 Tax=Spirilliplanes yamanashiensis TaxID=42233 RepID=A0A8J3YD82_9ACTN|nr:cyclophilin-like fold protein [Spirilliplanes yamanashiensis]MDP9819119.1 hypothetical protein [Spirilliplanes yamanashiensis]GIJ05573.1 hypothetical protein Sya03_49250 [Spirilliplanes yamanashiensis]
MHPSAGTAIQLRTGDQRLRATLDDSAAGRDLVAQLPLTIDMTDHGAVEKTGPLPAPLSRAGQPDDADPAVGDVGYYAPGNDLVLYHGDQSYFPGIVILGRLEVTPQPASPPWTARSPSPSSCRPPALPGPMRPMDNVDGVTTAENAADQGSALQPRRLIRDVGVNVVANLIAAAIIYVGGALIEVFPRNDRALWAAATVLLSATCLGLAALSSRFGWAWGAAVIGGAVVFLIIGFTTVDDVGWSVYWSIMSAAWLAAGVWLIREVRD